MQMGQQMAGAVSESASMASFATPELRGLFEEWVKAVEEEILGFLKEKGGSEPSGIAAKLKISEESVIFLIGKMAREKKIKITGIRAEGWVLEWKQDSISETKAGEARIEDDNEKSEEQASLEKFEF